MATGSQSTQAEVSVYGFETSNMSALPRPGQTYVLRSAKCGRDLALWQGRVTLLQPPHLGSPYWTCQKVEGWLRFANTATGQLLALDEKSNTLRTYTAGTECFKFHIYPTLDGSFTLLVFCSPRLGTIVYAPDKDQLQVAHDLKSDGISWHFIEYTNSKNS